jgi:hypothetical protein
VNPGTSDHTKAISIIDVATNTVIGYVQDPSNLLDHPVFVVMSPDGISAYALSNGSSPNTVNYIDVRYDTVTQNVIGNPSFPFINLKEACYTLDGSTAYIADAGSTLLSMIDVTSNIKYNQMFTGIHATHVKLSPNGARLYSSDDNGHLAINDTGTYALITTLSIPGAGAIGFDPIVSSSKAYVASSSGVAIIDVMNNVIANNPSVTGASPSPLDIVFTPDGTIAYLVHPTFIEMVDVAYDSVVETLELTDPSAALNQAYYLALTPDGSKGFVPNAGATAPGSVSIITDPPLGGLSLSPSLILPPSTISGCKMQNKFMLQTDYINKLTWVAPITGTIPVAYNIYRDAYLTDLVATTSSSSTLQYYDHGRNPNTIYSYYITSVDGSGNQSTAASVTVTNPC